MSFANNVDDIFSYCLKHSSFKFKKASINGEKSLDASLACELPSNFKKNDKSFKNTKCNSFIKNIDGSIAFVNSLKVGATHEDEKNITKYQKAKTGMKKRLAASAGGMFKLGLSSEEIIDMSVAPLKHIYKLSPDEMNKLIAELKAELPKKACNCKEDFGSTVKTAPKYLPDTLEEFIKDSKACFEKII